MASSSSSSSQSSASSSSTSPLPPPLPPLQPPPFPPRSFNINLLYWLAVNWPLNTNFLTVLQSRYIAHSFFLPTYLSPLHPSAASSASHPTHVLYRRLRDVSFRSLWTQEGLRGMFRGIVPSIAALGVRGYVLSDGVMDAGDNGTLLASGGRAALQRQSTAGGESKDEVALQIQIFLPFIDPQRVPLATLAAYPLDHIRTLLQLIQHNTSAVRAPHSVLAPAGSAIDYILTSTSSSATATVRSLVQQYGVAALYRGVVPAMVGQTALIGSGLQLFDEVMQWIRTSSGAVEDELDETDSMDVKEKDHKVVFPLSLIDRLSNSPALVSSTLLFLSSYLLVFYPASVVSTHMRAATFSSAHISTQPLTSPPHPAASHHLHMYAASSPPATSSTTLPSMMATIRRIGSEQGVRGFYRGFTLHLCKVALVGVWWGWAAGFAWLANQHEDK